MLNIQGAKFHLILCLCLKDQNNQNSIPKILFSKISEGIFVDSRLAARPEKQKGGLEFFSNLFQVKNLSKQLVKKVKSKKEKITETIIENNLEGLLHYLSAPNIRRKSKHLLFLAFRFSEVFKIFLNNESTSEKLGNIDE